MDVFSSVKRDIEEFTRQLLDSREGMLLGDGDEDFLAYCASGGLDWHAFLVEHGRSWNGSDDLWPTFRLWFTYHAEARSFAAPAAEFLAYVETRPDRIAAFAEHGMAIDPPRPVAEVDPAVCPYDEEAWVAFLTEHGPAWDGTDAGWPTFTQAFLRLAAECGLDIPSTAFVEYVAARPDKRTVFGQYEIPVPPAAEAKAVVEAPAAAPAELAAEPAAELAAESVEPAETTTELAAEVAEPPTELPTKTRTKAKVSGAARRPRARSSTRRTAA